MEGGEHVDFKMFDKLKEEVEEKDATIKMLREALEETEAKLNGKEQTIKVLGDIIVKMTHANQSSGSNKFSSQPSRQLKN